MISHRVPKWIATGCAALALLTGASGCKTRDQPEVRGQQTAEQWCSECHRVEPDQPSGARMGHILPSPMHGPDFTAIADRPGVNAQWLRGFMADLHLPMPTYRLPPDRQDDVIAYILSLKGMAATP